MGSSTTGAAAAAAATILFYIVLLTSAVAAAPEAYSQDSSGFLSTAALACSSNVTAATATVAPSRKLTGGVDVPPQIPGPCPVPFDRMTGYDALAGECKGPQMTAQRCCKAFKGFACPFSDMLNNVSNGCADDMFYHISTKGDLPPGIFYMNCREGPEGLKC